MVYASIESLEHITKVLATLPKDRKTIIGGWWGREGKGEGGRERERCVLANQSLVEKWIA